MKRPWTVFVQDVGPKFTFADEHQARQRARELVEDPHVPDVLVYRTESDADPDPDPSPNPGTYPDVCPYPDTYNPDSDPYPKPDPYPYDERWVYRRHVDPVREVSRSGVWSTVDLEPRFSVTAVQADNNHRLVPVNVRFWGWALAWRGTCLTCGGQCYRRLEVPERQVWRHGFPTD